MQKMYLYCMFYILVIGKLQHLQDHEQNDNQMSDWHFIMKLIISNSNNNHLKYTYQQHSVFLISFRY